MHLSTNLKMLIDRQNSSSTHTSEQPSVRDQFSKVEQEANARELSLWTWLAILTATAVTMNSAESMIALFHYTMCTKSLDDCVAIAEFMREIGLRCIGINGIPRSINILDEFHKSLPFCIASLLNTTPSRHLQARSVDAIKIRGQALWRQLHHPLDAKIEYKLRAAHPDLPVYVINYVYGGLFIDPIDTEGALIGRIEISLAAIACLRAQAGVEPQLLGHVRGLKKAWEDGSWKSEPCAGTEEGIGWLVSDEGCTWVLQTIDNLAKALSGGWRDPVPIKAKI